MLFLGAGASAPLDLKPTGPFLELLPEKLCELIPDDFKKGIQEEKAAAQFSTFFSKAAQHFRVDLPDSEVVLDYLNSLVETCNELDKLPDIFRQLTGTVGSEDYHRRWENMFSQIQRYIQKVVVEHYSRVDGKRVLEIYNPLLHSLCTRGQILPVYTTNYDWAFEYLAGASGAGLYLEDGFRDSPLAEYWASDVFDEFRPHPQNINLVLFKLHGSTSWYKDLKPPQSIRKFPNPAPELAGSTAVLIYPTQVKAEAIQEEPFKTAYEYFRETVLHTNLIVIIGFSFRDPAINETLDSALTANKDLRLVVVEPKMDEDPGIVFGELLHKLGIKEDNWKERMRVIKGNFGDDQFVYDEIATTVQKLDQWDDLQPWVAKS